MRHVYLLGTLVFACGAQTPAPPPGQADIRVDVPLVSVSCSVTDRNGPPLQNLKREDFTLLDNAHPRDIQYFWQETDLPLTIGLIVDVSGSQIGCINHHRETIARFLTQVLGPRDRAFLVTVASDVKLLVDLTGSVDELREGIGHLQMGQRTGTQLGEPCRGPGSRKRRGHIMPGCGGTALWNGVYAAARLKMKPLTGRKALIVLSDGLDTGSFHSLTDAIEASEGADTLVYTIRCVSAMVMISPGMAIRAAVGRGLKRLAEETGGHPYPNQSDPATTFRQIEAELRNLYVLGFSPPEEARNGVSRKLQVKMTQPGATVRSRKSYSTGLPAPVQ